MKIKLISAAIATIALTGCVAYPASYYNGAYVRPSIGVYVRPAPYYNHPGFYAPRRCNPYGCR